jgi:hypothetical protein
MMGKIAFGLTALTIATAGSTLTALALPGGTSLGVAQSLGHVDNNIDEVTLRRTRAFHYGINVPPLRRAFGFHPILGRRRTVIHHY